LGLGDGTFHAHVTFAVRDQPYCVALVDLDGDSYPDGVEFVLDSNPKDAYHLPILEPKMRIAAYYEEGFVKLGFASFPGDVSYLQSFFFEAAYSSPSDGNVITQVELTPLIPLAISEASQSYYKGILLSVYIMKIPASSLEIYSPMSFGVAARYSIGPTISTDVADIHFLESVPVRHYPLHEFNYMDSIPKVYSILKPNPPQTWVNNQVCSTQLEIVDSKDGVTTYEVTNSNCTSMEEQMCSSGPCGNLTGTRVVSIDPGYLESRVY